MNSLLKAPADDEEPADSDRAFDEELRAARRSWWMGLLSVELGVLFAILPLPLLLGPTDSVTGNQQFLTGSARLVDAMRVLGTRADSGYTPFEPLAVLATIGVAAAVALNAAHSRFDSARRNVRVGDVASRRQVFEAQHAMSGSVAVFGVTLAALLCAHLLVLASVLAAYSGNGERRLEAAAVAALSVLMGAFLLVECARLLAPWRSPHQVRPRGHARAVQRRLSRLVGEAGKRLRRIKAFRWAVGVIAVAMTVLAAIAGGSDFMQAVAGAATLFIVLTTLLVRFASSAVFEVGFMRVMTVGYPVALSTSVILTLTAALLRSILEVGEARWVTWALIPVVLLWLALWGLTVLRIFGQAGIGYFRLYGARYVALIGLPIPARVRDVRRDVGCVGFVVLIELLMSLPVLLLLTCGESPWRVLVSGAVLIGAGLGVVALSACVRGAGLCRGFGDSLVCAGRGSALVTVAVLLGVLVLSGAVLVSAFWSAGPLWGVTALHPWLAVHAALLVIAVAGERRRLPIARRPRMAAPFIRFMGIPSLIGADALAWASRSRRQLAGRSLGQGAPWADSKVLAWWDDAQSGVVSDGSSLRGGSSAAPSQLRIPRR